MASWTHLRQERRDRTVWLAVDRPEAYNAVNMRVLEELTEAFEALALDESVRVIVLTGAGDEAFISGIDIEEFEGRSGVWWKTEFQRRGKRLEHAIESAPQPVIAAVNGYALGGGTEIALWCDLIVAAESATFGQAEIRAGMMPGGGGTQRLAHRIGRHRAKELVLTGRFVEGAEAESIGLVNETVPDDELSDRVEALAAELAGGPRFAQAMAKEAINRAFPGQETAFAMEEALSTAVFETDDAREGVRAFLEDREPAFEE